MPNGMLHTLYVKAIREASTEEGKKHLENAAAEEMLSEGGLI